MLRLLLCLFCSSMLLVQGQSSRRFVKIEAVTLQAPDLANHQLSVGFHFHRANGGMRKSRNLSLFGVPWDQLNVWVEQGHFSQGTINFDPAAVYQHDNYLRFRVSHVDRPAQVYHFQYAIPYPTALELAPNRQTSIRPGQTVSLRLTLQYSNGYRMEQSPSLLRRLFFLDAENLPVDLQSDGQLGQDLRITLPRSVFFTDSLYVSGSHPWADVSDTLALPVDYRSAQYFSFAGSNSSDEFWGNDGEWGEDGEQISVWVQSVAFEGRKFLRVKASSDTHTEATLVEVGGEGLLIDVSGGDGGDGGDGSDGDDGKNATEEHAAKPGENGEDGGDGGDGGNGGQVKLYLDHAAEPYLDLIQFDLRGGEPGEGGEGGEGGQGGKKLDESRQPDGKNGHNGHRGHRGYPGSAPETIFLTPAQLTRILTGLGKS